MSDNPKALTPTFAFVRNCTVLKVKAVLVCWLPPLTALNRWAWGTSIELSEWARWGNLRPELVRACSGPLTEKVRGGLAPKALRAP